MKAKKFFLLLVSGVVICMALFTIGCATKAPALEAGSAKTTAEQADGSITDITAYSEDRALTDDDWLVFEKAFEGLVGVRYAPVSVATQVSAGINYRFTAAAFPVVPNAVSYTVHIFIFKPLSGEAELTRIVRLE